MGYKDKQRQREYQAAWYQRNKQRLVRSQRDKRSITQRRLAEYKTSLSCSVCGYNRCSKALDFHHDDPGTKTDTVSNLARNAKSWGRVQAEIDKCTVLCRNCHSELHAGIITRMIGPTRWRMQELSL